MLKDHHTFQLYLKFSRDLLFHRKFMPLSMIKSDYAAPAGPLYLDCVLSFRVQLSFNDCQLIAGYKQTIPVLITATADI